MRRVWCDRSQRSLARLIIIEGEPAIILRTWLLASAVPALSKEQGFADGLSLYSYLSEAGIRLGSAHARLDVEFANTREAELLGVAFGSPLLAVRSVAFGEAGPPLEVSSIRYNSKRVALTFDREIGLAS